MVFIWPQSDGVETAEIPAGTQRISVVVTSAGTEVAAGEVGINDVVDGQATLRLAVPAGTVQVLTQAWNAAGLEVGRGTAPDVTIIAGQTNQVLVDMNLIAVISVPVSELVFGPDENEKVLPIRNAGNQDDHLQWTLEANRTWVAFDQTFGWGESDVTVAIDRGQVRAAPAASSTATILVRSANYTQTLSVAVTVQGEAPPDEALAGYWYPPRVGGTWSYQQTRTSGDDEPWLDTYTIFLQRTDDITTLPGHTVWVMHWREHTEDDWGTYFVEVTPDQVRLLGDRWEDEYEIGILDPPLVWLTGNAIVGNTWQFALPHYDTTGTATVTAVNQTVTVPAGTFQDCVKVEYVVVEEWADCEGQTITLTEHWTRWYARGVGLVREHWLERLCRNSELFEEWEETQELLSYPQ